jgi:hypothetical protein
LSRESRRGGHPLADAVALLRGIGWAARRRRAVDARVVDMLRIVRDARQETPDPGQARRETTEAL